MAQTSNHKSAEEIINSLKAGNFYCECLCGCGKKFLFKDAGLFYLDDFSPEAYGKYKEMKSDLRERKVNMPARSERAAKSSNWGNEIEGMTPSLKGFKFKRNDCRFLAEPIDYIIFEGLYDKGMVTKIIFSDVKTGNARLSTPQKAIKGLIESKKVVFKTY